MPQLGGADPALGSGEARPEALDGIRLVVWTDDSKSRWSADLLGADRAALAESEGKAGKGNRDGKFRLTR